MKRMHMMYACSLTALGLFALVGCQTTETIVSNSPGALPSGRVGPHDEQKLNATTLFSHGHLLERQGYFDRAVEQYRKAIEAQPNFTTAFNRMGIALNKLGRHNEASAAFRKALSLEPGRADLHNNLGFSYYLEDRHSDAASELDQAIRIDPDYARAYMNRALVYAAVQRFEEAYQQLAKVCTEADACYNMGMILSDARRYAEAAQYLEAALVAKPDFEPARQQLHAVARLAAENPVAPTSPQSYSPQVARATPTQPDQPSQTTTSTPGSMQPAVASSTTPTSAGQPSSTMTPSGGSTVTTTSTPPTPRPVAAASSPRPVQPAASTGASVRTGTGIMPADPRRSPSQVRTGVFDSSGRQLSAPSSIGGGWDTRDSGPAPTPATPSSTPPASTPSQPTGNQSNTGAHGNTNAAQHSTSIDPHTPSPLGPAGEVSLIGPATQSGVTQQNQADADASQPVESSVRMTSRPRVPRSDAGSNPQAGKLAFVEAFALLQSIGAFQTPDDEQQFRSFWDSVYGPTGVADQPRSPQGEYLPDADAGSDCPDQRLWTDLLNGRIGWGAFWSELEHD